MKIVFTKPISINGRECQFIEVGEKKGVVILDPDTLPEDFWLKEWVDNTPTLTPNQNSILILEILKYL